MMGTGDDVASGSGVEWRVLRRGPLEWVLLTGNRLVVGGMLLLVVAGSIWGVVLTGLAPLQERTPMLYLLFALISGNFALITIVVSLSQFVLARHLESPDEIRRRMNEMVGYRREVGEVAHRSVLPITHPGFLAVLFHNVTRLVDELERQSPSIGDERARREIAELAAGLGPHAEYVIDLVETSDRGVKSALFATLNTSYATYIYDAWHLESEHGETLPEKTRDELEGLVRGLEQVEVARRFFKTVLIQSELASLSRLLLYVGLPIQLATVVIMLLFTATSGVGVSPGVLSVVIPLVVTLGFAPIVLLAAYILRLATVAHRTAAMYPFADESERVSSMVDGDRWDEQPSADEESNATR
jgi:hypothetical protein